MMLLITRKAICTNSYKETEKFFKDTLDIKINDDTIRSVVNYIGEIVYNKEIADVAKINNERKDLKMEKNRDGILYLETDGNFIRTRQENNEILWKESKNGVCFTSDNIIKYVNKNGEECHRIENREYVSYIGSADEFKPQLFALAQRNGYGQYKTTILLSDGAEWIKNFRKEYIADAIHILDFFHLIENSATFLNYIYNNCKVKVDTTLERWKNLFIESKFREILEEIEMYHVPKGAFNFHNYLEKNFELINYKYFIDNGYFIGSGLIESTNKYLVQSRLKLPGMSWKIINAQYIATLRAKNFSGLWDSYVVKVVYDYFNSMENIDLVRRILSDFNDLS